MPEHPVKSLSVLAPAKINLYLHVTGRRGDGYHLLDSLVAFASIGDRISIKPSGAFSFRIEGPYASAFTAAELESGPESQNLAVRAARGLGDLLGRRLDLALTLTKNMPLAAGLGGGSADAAAVIRAMLDAWQVAPQAVQGLDAFLLSLGADVPVCMRCRPAVIRGIGEEITYLDEIPEMPILLVNPQKHCPTPDVFKAFAGREFSAPHPVPVSVKHTQDYLELLLAARNDLEAPAQTIVPGIKTVLEAISNAEGGRLARMSGSGASCFGLFENEELCLVAAEQIRQAHQDWWIRAGTLGRPQRH
ncbi:MAG: 4-(cytidine 5'-diphospho)-2-C-methyl-D-erythritol kinase [Rhodospirillales bacterium]|nr:4-(cytidine 5'-diphospho)-2-C-methyl-D-erythritol kinase [Rhodospirillales bacterium]MCB9996956.1 4-(cytidine 5'-diphospho)-2-C-methyl-D-erythritol kinase [Rhodospirillales bacterium]